MNRFFLTTLLLFAGLYPLSAQQKLRPADAKATPATVKLYGQLHTLLGKGVLFGHQDDLGYGVHWKYEHNRSDVKEVCGDYPGVYGWDLGKLEMDSPHNLDSMPFDSLRNYIRYVYDRGGVNTISWHLNNPGNGGSAWDTFHVVKDILPGGNKHLLYTSWLDKVAAFLISLKGSDGSAAPVIFRPFHEHTGSWFWWGQRHCSAKEYKQLWQFTIKYLQQKNVHNALYAYSAAGYNNAADYLERYPGDQFVDIIGTDIYQYSTSEVYTKEASRRLDILEKVAVAHKKIPALTETGYERVPDATWWTGTLLPLLKSYRLSYVLLWRNGRPDHYYAPFSGQTSEADFKRFYEDPYTIFQGDLTALQTGGTAAPLIDPDATAATRALYQKLYTIKADPHARRIAYKDTATWFERDWNH
jgi:hypothetical protein